MQIRYCTWTLQSIMNDVQRLIYRGGGGGWGGGERGRLAGEGVPLMVAP